MKYYQVAIHTEGTIWVQAESGDAALAQAEGFYGIEDADGRVTSYELVKDAD